MSASNNPCLKFPCYVVEEELLRKNLALIKHVADKAGVEIILAFKAFALWKTFPIFREYIQHTTASSPSEARLAFQEFGSLAHSYSPAYTEENISDFISCSSHITFNSLSQFSRFHNVTQNPDHPISCGLRINPEYSEIETALYNPCAPGSRFGVTEAQLLENGGLPQGVEGFHCHCHCENNSYTLQRTLAHLEKHFSRWLPNLKWLNLGGGHLITHKDYDTEHLIALLKSLRERYPNLRIILEPGSAFAWQTGHLQSHVVDIVENHGIKTAILDVSFACHMPDCLEMPYKPTVRNAETVEDLTEENYDKYESEDSHHIYRLGGNSCLSGDFIGAWKFNHELQIGEEIIFEDMIHYTTVKTLMFNGISHPSIAIKKLDGEIKILKQFTYEDYKNRMD